MVYLQAFASQRPAVPGPGASCLPGPTAAMQRGGAVNRTAAALLLLPLSGVGRTIAHADAKDAKKDGKKDESKKEPYSAGTFAGLKLRSIGPALTSGRVADLAVDP